MINVEKYKIDNKTQLYSECHSVKLLFMTAFALKVAFALNYKEQTIENDDNSEFLRLRATKN
jgi:hypothetical protein